ncbi:MAG TPA: FimB/Mfa2 family fimbrial subunit [Prevotella sp.]
MKTKLIYFLLLCVAFAGCERPVLEGEMPDPEPQEGLFAITLSVSRLEQFPFEPLMATPRSKSVSEICSRLQFAVFKGDTKVTSVNQTSNDKDFGKISVSLPAGTYRFVVLAHSGSGNATLTDLQKIKFANNKVTDTFYCLEEIVVDNSASYELELRRCVAQVKVVIEDPIPDEVKTMRFYYIGGSSTFDAVNGVGSVDSRQTEERMVTPEQHAGHAEFGIFTFPHAADGLLKLTVTALNASGQPIKDLPIDNIPIRKNRITQYTGRFFGGATNANAFSFVVNDEWEQIFRTY